MGHRGIEGSDINDGTVGAVVMRLSFYVLAASSILALNKHFLRLQLVVTGLCACVFVNVPMIQEK